MTRSLLWAGLFFERGNTVNDELHEDRKHLAERRKGRHDDKKYHDALARIDELEREVSAYQVTSDHIDDWHAIEPLEDSKTSEATVIALASDWHVDETVDPKTVQRRNKYTPEIAKKRADTFFKRIVKLTDKERQNIKVHNLVLWLGGDFLTGSIHEENLETTAMRPMDAILYAQELLSSGMHFLAEHGRFKRITVVCSSGNHARITHKIRHATREGNSLEHAMYHALAKYHSDQKWVIERGYHTYLKVYGHTFRFHHGDHVRYNGGVGGIYVPLQRAIYQWNQQQHADVECVG